MHRLRVFVLGLFLLLAACSQQPPPTVSLDQEPIGSISVDRASYSSTSLIVTMKPGVSSAERAALFDEHGLVETSNVAALQMYFVDITSGSATEILDALLADERVAHAERDKLRRTSGIVSDPAYASQWALPKIGWDQVYGTFMPEGAAVLAVLDTGVDGQHPDLIGRMVAGFSAFTGSDPTLDPHGHGTAVAGIAAAATHNETGIAGVAYAGVSIMPVQVLDAYGLGQDSDVIAGLVWAVDEGADVVLMAFSNPGYSPALQMAIDYAWSPGVVLVASVGNDASSYATFPAGSAKVMGVSATDEADVLWSQSNRGDSVFMAAPGVGIAALSPGDGTSSMTGTSASAAIVAGAAALMRAADEEELANGVIVGRLARNADVAGTVEETGNGRVHLARAVEDDSVDAVVPGGADPAEAGPIVGPYGVDVINDAVPTTHVPSGSSGCGAASDAFVLGEVICGQVQVTGTHGNENSHHLTISWIRPDGSVAQSSAFEGVAAADPPAQFFEPDEAGPWTFRARGQSTWNHPFSVDPGPTPVHVEILGLNQVFDGTARQVTVVTNPPGIGVEIKYDGSMTPPTNAGSFAIDATVIEEGYEGYASATLFVAKADAVIDVEGTTVTYDGEEHGATGTATGADSSDLTSLLDLGATFSDVPGGTATWSFAGDDNHNSANGSVDIVIDKAATKTVITAPPSPSVVNQPYRVSWTVEAVGLDNHPSDGTVLVPDGIESCSGDVDQDSCELTSKTAGLKTLTATYLGGQNFTSSDDSVDYTAGHRATKTTIECSPDIQTLGGTITCTVTVADDDAAAGAEAPTGIVTVSATGTDAPTEQTCTLATSTSSSTSSSCTGEYTSGESQVWSIGANYAESTVHGSSEIAVDERTLIVFYDPSFGHVTGGGWIISPPGAFMADVDLTGRANFGFVAQVRRQGQNTVLDGNTQFQFQAGGLNFHSTKYDWLVVSGGSNRAQFKGEGRIQGDARALGFMLTVIDGNPDKFRIKIWEIDGDVVYDNQPAAGDEAEPTTVIGGGNIVIHNPPPGGGRNN